MSLSSILKGASSGIVGMTLDCCDTHEETLVKAYVCGLMAKAFDQRPKLTPQRKARIALMIAEAAQAVHKSYIKDVAENTPEGGT